VKTQTATGAAKVAAEVAAVKTAAEGAAHRVADVKDTLVNTTAATDTKLDGIVKTGNAVHALVNSAMSAQLQVNAAIARRLAGITGEKGDGEAADAAEKAYATHEAKQRSIDAGRPA
jgi:hypothetical protein